MNNTNKPAELSYYGLYLLSYLKENHPDKAHDAAFVEERADRAADMFEQARREGYTPGGAHELVEVLWNECSDEIPQSEAPAVALKLLPYVEGIFTQYPLSDDFAYSPEYERLYTELAGAVLICIEENGI